ncbi:MAG: hypothetical protein ABI539_10090, partial [Acidobacteriota bacterium]
KDESGMEADSQIMAFEDTWHWKGAASTYDDLILEGDEVAEMLQAFRSFIRENQMMAYLVMMAVRLKLGSSKARARLRRFIFILFFIGDRSHVFFRVIRLLSEIVPDST